MTVTAYSLIVAYGIYLTELYLVLAGKLSLVGAMVITIIVHICITAAVTVELNRHQQILEWFQKHIRVDNHPNDDEGGL